MKLLYKLTGGRPMVRERFAFTDIVSGDKIYHFTDRLGRRWIATSPWALFRVTTEYLNKEEK